MGSRPLGVPLNLLTQKPFFLPSCPSPKLRWNPVTPRTPPSHLASPQNRWGRGPSGLAPTVTNLPHLSAPGACPWDNDSPPLG